MLSNSQLRGTESQQLSYLCTRTTPTATQTKPFANANPTIMPTAGNGSFRRPGVRAWQAIARLFMLFFRWWRGIVPGQCYCRPDACGGIYTCEGRKVFSQITFSANHAHYYTWLVM